MKKCVIIGNGGFGGMVVGVDGLAVFNIGAILNERVFEQKEVILDANSVMIAG
ncbi:hypothetical protein J4226_04820 [Candidatus Pacearchaeota archaeon]|nr:hypothetical protein [Candidatus Pacearchaeota archaeon]